MAAADQGRGFVADLGHVSLLVSLLIQTAVLMVGGERPVVRFLGSLITPVIYAAFEIRTVDAFILDIGHFNFWFFSLLVGGLQALALRARRGRARVTLEFLSTFMSVLVFLIVYFYFDVRVTHEQLVAAGSLTASQLQSHLSITSYGPDLVEFLSDRTHVYVVIGGVLLGLALARGRVKIVQLTERVSDLFGTYVDGRVRDRIIRAAGEPGETREVAVLFSDLRDFTGLTERSAAPAVVEMLNAYFSAWDRVCRAHGGIIDKFIGDAVMILFEHDEREDGPRTDACAAAVRCAFAMMEELAPLARDLAARRLPAPRGIGIGIDVGPVIMGAIGSETRRNYTAIGDTVNTASRLEGASKDTPRTVIISAAVHARLDAALAARFTPLGEIALKGKAGMRTVFGA
jgi:class 3 adenylate cyclase